MKFKAKAWDDINNHFVSPKFVQLENLLWVDERGFDVAFCTGLKDKEGNYIYEGDIIDDKFDVGQLKVIFYNSDKASFHIEWIDFKSFGKEENYTSPISTSPESITEGKIIGNIHQHSHLLEVENNHE